MSYYDPSGHMADYPDKDPEVMNTPAGQNTPLNLDSPVQDGTLNIGAGKRSIENTYNIDKTPTVEGVYQGIVENAEKGFTTMGNPGQSTIYQIILQKIGGGGN